MKNVLKSSVNIFIFEHFIQEELWLLFNMQLVSDIKLQLHIVEATTCATHSEC